MHIIPNTQSGGSGQAGKLPRLNGSGLLADSFLSAILQGFAGLTAGANKLAYFTGASTMDVADIGSTGFDLIAAADAAAARTAMSLGTMATQDASAILLGGNMDADGYTIDGLADAVNDDQPATYGQLRAMVYGRDWKDSVRAYRSAQLPPYSYSAGVITLSSNGAFPSQDGVSLSVGDRVFFNGETAGSQKYNGAYTVTALGDGSNPASFTRATDSDTSAKLTTGATYYIEEGTTYGSRSVVLRTAGPITLDTTALTFTLEASASLSSAAPENLGTSASAGTSSDAARSDHVHADTGLVRSNGTRAMTGQLTLAGLAEPPTMVSSNATDVVTAPLIWVNTTSGGVTRTLPDAPADGTVMTYRLLSGSNTLTISRGGSTDQIVVPGSSPANTIEITVIGEAMEFRYSASLAQWIV